MKQKLLEKVLIPEGVNCVHDSGILKCSKGSREVSRNIKSPEIEVSIDGSELVFQCKKGNKKHYKVIKSLIAHVKNMFAGLDKDFSYTIEAVFVHFPTTFKLEKDHFIINNFLGEKTPRKAKILPNVKVDIKGQIITLSSKNLEAAGQTAANIEKATKVRSRDRRIFQDGLFITEKPGRTI